MRQRSIKLISRNQLRAVKCFQIKEINRNLIRTIPANFDHTEYANFAVEMVRIECIALEMNRLNHYRCLVELELAIVAA